MYIDSNKLRQLRNERQWSQDQLATLSGLNLRTIQRLEAGAKISKESLRALSSVLEVPADSLLTKTQSKSEFVISAIRNGVIQGLDFHGLTTRAEFWWFASSIIIFLAFTKILSALFGQLPFHLASLIVLIPWVSACTRRLRDAGINVWYQLAVFIPVVGVLMLLIMLSLPSRKIEKEEL